MIHARFYKGEVIVASVCVESETTRIAEMDFESTSVL
jgi:hypothetical protein